MQIKDENQETQEQEDKIMVDVPGSESNEEQKPDITVEESNPDNSEENGSGGSEGKSGKSGVDKSDFKPEFLQQYGNMDKEQLLKQVQADQQFIGRRNQEIGELKKKVEKEESQSADDLKRKLKMRKEKLRKYKGRFSELDDDEERSAIKKDMNKLEGEIDDTEMAYKEKFMAERIYEEAAHDKNHELSKKMRDEYKKTYGLEFSDEEWKQFHNKTKESAKDFKMSPEDFDFSLMRGLGREKFMTMVKTQAAVNERQSIKNAALNSDVDIGGGARGGSRSVNLLEMSASEVRKIINNNPGVVDKLTVKQLDLLEKKLNK